MAKKIKNVVLDDTELKPQVIGYVYKKKSNLGRIILIFVALILVIYYINDISVYINKIIGKDSSSSIKDMANDENRKLPFEKKEEEEKYKLYSNDLVMSLENLNITNFSYKDNTLSFFAYNYTTDNIDLTNKKYYLETYNKDKNFIERFKIDFDLMEAKAQKQFEVTTKSDFEYVDFVLKTVDEYPNINLTYTEDVAVITCKKNNDTIKYSFIKDALKNVEYELIDNNKDNNYYVRYASTKEKSENYNKIEGITSSFSSNLSSYTIHINVDLTIASLENFNELYHYTKDEMPKVISYEMPTYGFTCN